MIDDHNSMESEYFEKVNIRKGKKQFLIEMLHVPFCNKPNIQSEKAKFSKFRRWNKMKIWDKIELGAQDKKLTGKLDKILTKNGKICAKSNQRTSCAGLSWPQQNLR